MSDYKNFFLFEGLSDAERTQAIKSLEEPKAFTKGDIIYSEKNFFRAIGYFISGTATAVANNKSNIVMKKFGAGMSFGVAAVFGEGNSYISTITAQEDCVIQFVSEQKLRELFSLFPVTAVNYISFLSEKVRFLNKKLSIISCTTAEDTVLKYLLESADDEGFVLMPKNMSLLAKSLGVGRSSLYRSLESLEKNGNIERQESNIRVIKL
ncbi:MAG: Crp/Fnr family transcriptional regulator [Clostridia bacterium]|nr:Crp/Fnr family transcriptional regulator [Clostridia bacterium]